MENKSLQFAVNSIRDDERNRIIELLKSESMVETVAAVISDKLEAYGVINAIISKLETKP